ncbi:hypothetical protein [Clostridium chauvoei]|uniref:Uncharacterized protein n=2 Tax=Clostridium chauvoei TaxID=46867 RepID=A0A1U6JKS4_9CLOT|nr:hypothetical protein [Clostridium chauvoei]ATD55655.1 hypothetical protein BTM20_10570 [Clostridium chauvoei]ATD56667.1 hypothetical protein BTM21_02450 [Clostridium chauvoei]MBX7280107.1 hypothetical protein [Clostridium chauvoei]MBX7282591.1 hypothetical protein [Clostridium chauvoei]MBX7284998.1 hypothetical protein [Clostridium chauvoei]
MSKCPFWSTSREKVSCYSDCPMNESIQEDEICPFKEHLTTKLIYKDSISEDFAYSQDKYFGYELMEKIMNY